MKIKEIPQNKEKLYKIACTGDSPAVKKDGEIVGCIAMSQEGGCEDCIANHSDKPCMNTISTYLDQEYCEYEKGELVEVSDDNMEWRLRYFAGMSEDPRFPYSTLPVYNGDGYTVNYVYCRKYGTLGRLKLQEEKKDENT